MGGCFWMGCGWFFFRVFAGGGGGGEEETPGHVQQGRFFDGRREFSNRPIFYVIYYILNTEWGFFCIMVQTIENGVHGPRCPGQTCVMFKFRQLDDLFHELKTVKDLMHLVPPRTPRRSGYGVLCTCGLCYMLFLLHV